jgi:hypothetical protein
MLPPHWICCRGALQLCRAFQALALCGYAIRTPPPHRPIPSGRAEGQSLVPEPLLDVVFQHCCARSQTHLSERFCKGALAAQLAAEFIAKWNPGAVVFLPNPTWGNHNKIFPNGGVAVKQYRYYNPETRGLHFEGMCADIAAAPKGSVILLHACARTYLLFLLPLSYASTPPEARFAVLAHADDSASERARERPTLA